MSVNAIGFVYSFAQASYLAYHLATGEYVFRHPLRYYFDFGMDQASSISPYIIIAPDKNIKLLPQINKAESHDNFPIWVLFRQFLVFMTL